MPVVVTCTIDWGTDVIEKILPELKKHTEVVLEEAGCQEFSFAIDIENPDIVIATERYTDYKAHEDHFKTKQWEHFSGVMEKYPPRNIEVKTYEAREVPHALD
ncbi:MAG: antibiotic biosynthesis monooxygenase [Pseudomonadota bacterium]|nr:antibiotic biosynthesis monooxygenase [Pseudomonadota bacterium]|tara:strand:+ start:56 stop:364 length:309 start_codon:yes stop_codon:yes gene_type:complete